MASAYTNTNKPVQTVLQGYKSRRYDPKEVWDQQTMDVLLRMS